MGSFMSSSSSSSQSQSALLSKYMYHANTMNPARAKWRYGTLYSGQNVTDEWTSNTLSSLDFDCYNGNNEDNNYNNRVTCIFVNEMNCDIILCWIDYNGHTHHYRVVSQGNSHVEQSYLGHSFVAWKFEYDADKKEKEDLKLKWITEQKDPVLAYRPTLVLKDDNNSHLPHVIVCRDDKDSSVSSRSNHPKRHRHRRYISSLLCLRRRSSYCRTYNNRSNVNNSHRRRKYQIIKWRKFQKEKDNDMEDCVVNNHSKVYQKVTVRCDNDDDDDDGRSTSTSWTLMCESGCWDTTDDADRITNTASSCNDHESVSCNLEKSSPLLFRKRFEDDLKAATARLPIDARRKLSERIVFWINVRHKYGKKSSPTEGRHLCFHPESGWLKANGETARKCHGVEVYRTSDYMHDYSLWGDGGVILHELSHAWHCCFVSNGYANECIRECYKEAMRHKIYERVQVHGPQGPFARAYACTNEMEYFAELSVALLSPDRDGEYNKWYPFNRQQLQHHDERAFSLFSKLWGLNTFS